MFGYMRLIAIILGFTCKKSCVKRIEDTFQPLSFHLAWVSWHVPLLIAHQRAVEANKTEPFPLAHPYSLRQLSLCELSIVLAASSIPVEAEPTVIRLLCCRGQAPHWMGYIQWMPQTRPRPFLWERSHSDLESLPQWRPSEQCYVVMNGLGACLYMYIVHNIWYVFLSTRFYVVLCLCVFVCLQFFARLHPASSRSLQGRVLQGVSGLLILAWGELWWRSLVLMSAVADAAWQSGTSLARLPPLMSSLFSIALFHPCFPWAIQPAQTILFSFTTISLSFWTFCLVRPKPESLQVYFFN